MDSGEGQGSTSGSALYVKEGIEELEDYLEAEAVRGRTRKRGVAGMDGKYRAYLHEATPFESASGECCVVSPDEYAFVVGAHYDHRKGEPILHLETEIDGTPMQAEVAYSMTTPYIKGIHDKL